MRALFTPPVVIWLGGSTKVTVNNATYAARLLDEEWPDEPDRAYDAARVACDEAISGADPAKARRLFERAARQAGILDG